MFGDLEIKFGAAPSDNEITIAGQKIEGVNRIEIIAQSGKPSQAMLFMIPSQVGLHISMWDVDSETAQQLAEAIAKRLGIQAFTSDIYNEIVHFRGGDGVTN